MSGHRLFESRDLSQAAGFLGACLSRAQHRTAGVEAAARGDVGRIRRLAGQDLMGPAATDLRSHGEQGFRVRVQGLGEHRLRRSKLDDLAQIHDCDPVADMLDNAQVMRDEKIREPEFFLQVLNLTLGMVSIIIAHTTFCIGFVAIIVRARLQGMDESIFEAARDLGASPWQTFRLVTLPLIMPAVVAGALMSFTLSIDDFVITFFTIGKGMTLPTFVFAMIRTTVTPDRPISVEPGEPTHRARHLQWSPSRSCSRWRAPDCVGAARPTGGRAAGTTPTTCSTATTSSWPR